MASHLLGEAPCLLFMIIKVGQQYFVPVACPTNSNCFELKGQFLGMCLLKLCLFPRSQFKKENKLIKDQTGLSRKQVPPWVRARDLSLEHRLATNPCNQSPHVNRYWKTCCRTSPRDNSPPVYIEKTARDLALYEQM